MLILKMSDIITADGLNMIKTIQDVKNSFSKYYSKQIGLPMKIHLENYDKPQNGYINIMPGLIKLENGDISGIKLISRNNNNLKNYNIPNATGVLILFDPNTKTPMVMMDCQIISAMRTGAVSGYAARYLLKKEEIKNVTLIGSGVNMKTQVLGLLEILSNAKKVEVYSPNSSDNFIQSMNRLNLNLNLQRAISIENSVKKADLIISCTTNLTEQLIKFEWLKEKVAVFSIGGYDFIPKDIKKFDLLVADDKDVLVSRNADALAEAYHKEIINKESIYNLENYTKINKNVEYQKLYFCTVGLGCHDLIVADRIYKYAIENNLGERIEIFDNLKWI